MRFPRPLWPQFRPRRRVIGDPTPKLRNQHTRRVPQIASRELNRRFQNAGAVTLDIDLRTRDIKLRLVWFMRGVQRKAFSAQ
jgi:hypothetical protein